jgi:hypothetical protein
MPQRKEVNISSCNSIDFTGAGSSYVVQTLAGVFYCVYVADNGDVMFRKSADKGISWTSGTLIFTGATVALSIWYDRWSNISGDLIHCAYQESVTDDTLYRTINTASSDALSTQTVIFAGASTAAGGHLSITRAVGGNVYCKTVIDAGAEGGFFRLPNANVPNGAWDAARTVDEVIATTDQMILLPDYDAADTQDIMAIFWDASADEISRKLYDDSANSWSETSIAASMVNSLATTAFPHFAVAMDITNTRHILVAWSDVDTLNADLRCWIVDASTITEVTNVVTNSTDDQGLCAISLDLQTGYWHVFYAGKSDGSETWTTSVNLYMKTSKDNGTTWGAETLVTTRTHDIRRLIALPRVVMGPPVAYFTHLSPVEANDNIASVEIGQPRTTVMIGL